MTGLYISGCGEMGRMEQDGTDKMVPSFNLPTLDQAFGRRLSEAEMEVLWDLQHRAFLRGPDEVALYEQWLRMTEVVGIEGAVSFAPEDSGEWIGFRLYLKNGKVWASWEPCAPVDAAEFWAAIDQLVALCGPGVHREVLDEGPGLVSGDDSVDRHEDLSFDLPQETVESARSFLSAVAATLVRAHTHLGARI